MSVAPRLLRRVSQRLFFTSFPLSRETVCLQCRILATRHSFHTYRRRPAAVPDLRCHVKLGQKRTYLIDVLKADLAQAMTTPVENLPQNPGIAVLSALTHYIDNEVGFEPTTSELVKAFEVIAHDPLAATILRDKGNCYGIIRLLETLSLREELSIVQDKEIELLLNALEASESDTAVSLAGILLDYIRRVRPQNQRLLRAGFDTVVATLANTGDFAKAIGFLKAGAESYGREIIQAKPWWHLMRTVIAKDDEETLLLLAGSPEAKDEDHLGEFGVLQGLLRFYLDREDTAAAKKWWEDMKSVATSITCQTIFGYAVGHPEDALAQSWTQQMFDELDSFQSDEADSASMTGLVDEELTPGEELEIMKAKWKMTQGVGVHEIASLVQSISPRMKIEMINELVDFTIWRKDSDSSQFLLMLAERLGLEGNRRTQMLQIRVGILFNHPAAAMAAWENLKYFDEVEADEAETVPLLNLMASNLQTDQYTIEALYNDIKRRKLQIDADSLSNLFLWHILNSEVRTTVEVVSREINNYSFDDRLKIIKVMGEYMGRPETDIGISWQLYQAMRDMFPEMPRSVRREFMELFFSRDCPDLAGVVFTQMRHSSGAMPDVDTYISAFRNCAKLEDYQRVWEIHMQLKVDPNIRPTTELYNSLMWAYNCCNHPNQAFDVFRVITNTREGPNNDTLSLIMTTCGLGREPAMKRRSHIIWNNFKKLGIKPTMNNHAMRIVGWCYADLYDMAFKIFREMEEKEGARPDREVFMNLYAEFHPDRRKELERWTAKNLPEVWEEVSNDPSEPLKQYEGQVHRWFHLGPDSIK
ncbi:hypothetical protein DRE_04257 [Drechslerella stenobrocha 248]|uniref:Complex I intermediate-associated protein 84, mitochondrial n=1 Tax=Drechslerella stenobrocha 248 TaxID=1043628 RepID=W7HT76_9PEZI|nr:hypothetical protein DRE_04257 [Drechslerella stenobrocha 248]